MAKLKIPAAFEIAGPYAKGPGRLVLTDELVADAALCAQVVESLLVEAEALERQAQTTRRIARKLQTLAAARTNAGGD